MLDPYRMVVVNLIAITLLAVGIIFYKYVYPKKKINLTILLFFLALLPLISILRKGTYESGDMSLHAKYTMDFFKNLSEGNLIPRISSIVCAKHGCPDFIFMYPFPYYLASFFHLIGFSFVSSIKLLLASTFISSGFFVYFWMKEKFGERPAFVSGVFYLFAPYHLMNMHFRTDIAEMTSYAILPLCFLTTRNVVSRKEFKWFLANSFAISLLMLSHQSIALFGFPFIILYAFIEALSLKKISLSNFLYYIFSNFVGIMLVSYYLITILAEREFIYWGQSPTIYFPEFLTFIYTPWRYGLLFQGPMGELRTLVGYIQLLIAIISTAIIINTKFVSNLIDNILITPGKYFGLFRKNIKKTNLKFDNNNKILLIFFLFSFYFIFFMMQSISKPLWDFIPLIINTQISSRILVLASLFIAVVSGLVTFQLKNKTFFIAICLLAIIPTILNWGNRGTYPTIDDNYLMDELINKGSFNGVDFTTPIWVSDKSNWINQVSKYPIEVIKGKAEIIQINRTTTKHEYLINVSKDALIRENIHYFPGWILNVNNKRYPIEYNNPQHAGLMLFNLKKGVYKIEFNFIDTPVRAISKFISLLTLLSLFVYSLIFKLPKLFSQRLR